MKQEKFKAALEKVGVEWFDYLTACDHSKQPGNWRQIIEEGDSPQDILFSSFPWDETEQKHDYWADVCKALEGLGV